MELIRGDKGVTATEYGLIGALISIVIMSGVTLTGFDTKEIFCDVGSALQTAVGGDASKCCSGSENTTENKSSNDTTNGQSYTLDLTQIKSDVYKYNTDVSNTSRRDQTLDQYLIYYNIQENVAEIDYEDGMKYNGVDSQKAAASWQARVQALDAAALYLNEYNNYKPTVETYDWQDQNDETSLIADIKSQDSIIKSALENQDGNYSDSSLDEAETEYTQ